MAEEITLTQYVKERHIQKPLEAGSDTATITFEDGRTFKGRLTAVRTIEGLETVTFRDLREWEA